MRHESRAREVTESRQRNRRRQSDETETEIERKRSGPRKARTAEPLTHYHHASERRNDGSRHTTNPPVPCLGRSFLADKVRKGRRVGPAPATAPSGGRFWHGSAVRRPLLGGGGRALTFGPGGKDFGSHPVHGALPLDREHMRTKAPGSTFFTERTLAASDRTIRN
jgi:hypothetical protein